MNLTGLRPQGHTFHEGIRSSTRILGEGQILLPLKLDIGRPILSRTSHPHPAVGNIDPRAIRATRLPRVEGRGTWSATEGGPFRPETLGQVALQMRWAPFAAGTRRPRTLGVAYQREALVDELADLRGAVALDVERAYTAVIDARAAVPVRERGVELTMETLRVEQERHRAGRATTNDLLDAEARLRDQRTARDLARIEVARAWVALDLARGADLGRRLP